MIYLLSFLIISLIDLYLIQLISLVLLHELYVRT